jgi:hypothetical protein
MFCINILIPLDFIEYNALCESRGREEVLNAEKLEE